MPAIGSEQGLIIGVNDTHQIRMSEDNIHNALTSIRLLAEASLNIVQDFRMSRLAFVENSLELMVSRSESVAEMLGKDPSAVWDNALQSATVQPKKRSEGAYKHMSPLVRHVQDCPRDPRPKDPHQLVEYGRKDSRVSSRGEMPL